MVNNLFLMKEIENLKNEFIQFIIILFDTSDMAYNK
jgi:hypothetical protein